MDTIKLTEVEIILSNISTEDLIKELKKRDEFPVVRPEYILEGARGKHISK